MNVNQTEFKPFDMAKLVPILDKYCFSGNSASANYHCGNLIDVMFCYANKAKWGRDKFFCEKCNEILNPTATFNARYTIYYHINALTEYKENSETIITSCNDFYQACLDLEKD